MDIVERLREQQRLGLMGVPDDFDIVGYGEAADHIEELREALTHIDALDPEGHIFGVSHDACRGLIARMGDIARAALDKGENQ